MALIKKDFLKTVKTCEMPEALIPRFCKWKKTVKAMLNSEQIQF